MRQLFRMCFFECTLPTHLFSLDGANISLVELLKLGQLVCQNGDVGNALPSIVGLIIFLPLDEVGSAASVYLEV